MPDTDTSPTTTDTEVTSVTPEPTVAPEPTPEPPVASEPTPELTPEPAPEAPVVPEPEPAPAPVTYDTLEDLLPALKEKLQDTGLNVIPDKGYLTHRLIIRLNGGITVECEILKKDKIFKASFYAFIQAKTYQKILGILEGLKKDGIDVDVQSKHCHPNGAI